ncbi:Glycosyltransferase involved in cell wall bisynthesis [Micromonospora pallida]|uniref:Glycosyltransferase involved in cell wall bisynthesis n=1 Tax=Micromonospora pallida TaxID=145854 RepID=A0A1C6SRU1_9ACTN|nr:glycosyltransferase family 1 protein [Micromonospora pallida]SCL32180.1 Glycosyltransferase involved in cell wall bisynthesis [Micromonospora pallida]
METTTPASGWRPLGETPIRLGLGPANYAGQAAAFAEAICRHRADVSAEVTTRRTGARFAFPTDIHIEPERLGDLDLQIEQLQRVIGRYTHLVADAFLPVFGLLNGHHIGADLPALRQAGVKVALLAHGSEVRHPVRHRERTAHSPFHTLADDVRDKMTARAERNRRVAETSGLPVFVTTPDLLLDLPSATWAPVVVNVSAWHSDEPVLRRRAGLRRRRPVVLHAPSKRWTKGTEQILPVLTSLHDEGVIDLRLAEKMPWTELRDLVRSADVVLDQFALGSYGTFAVEAMAAGRPVLAYLHDEVVTLMDEPPPIVNATPQTLRDELTALVADPRRAARIGAESVEYAREYHDGRRTARVFEEFLDA